MKARIQFVYHICRSVLPKEYRSQETVQLPSPIGFLLGAVGYTVAIMAIDDLVQNDLIILQGCPVALDTRVAILPEVQLHRFRTGLQIIAHLLDQIPRQQLLQTRLALICYTVHSCPESGHNFIQLLEIVIRYGDFGREREIGIYEHQFIIEPVVDVVEHAQSTILGTRSPAHDVHEQSLGMLHGIFSIYIQLLLIRTVERVLYLLSNSCEHHFALCVGK